MRTAFTATADGAWPILFLVWLPGYFAMRRTARVGNPLLQIPGNILFILAFALLFSRTSLGPGSQVTPQTTAFGAAGLALNLAGVLFAIWARLMLGRNWSGTIMQVKQDHQLIQTGPYAVVRHPIYTGFLAAFLGSALTRGTLAAYLALVFATGAVLIRVGIEEGLMRDTFGEAHAAWRRRTKRLIPFVW
jgi:protein-S-isoprenylcysteine O-methyltransferase Ste14